LDGKVSQEGEDVKSALVVGDQDVALAGIDILHALNSDAGAGGAQLDLSPKTGNDMREVPGGIKERKENGHRSQNDCGDEKDEIAEKRPEHEFPSLPKP
jgi:hypothetical protein